MLISDHHQWHRIIWTNHYHLDIISMLNLCTNYFRSYFPLLCSLLCSSTSIVHYVGSVQPRGSGQWSFPRDGDGKLLSQSQAIPFRCSIRSVRPTTRKRNLSKVSNGIGLLGPSMDFLTLVVLKRVGVYVRIFGNIALVLYWRLDWHQCNWKTDLRPLVKLNNL